jgi:hypothetical protein
MISLFQKYSTVLDYALEQHISTQQNILYVDEKGDVIHAGLKLKGLDKIMALIAI